jgi:peptide/nickel transport system permease protein
VVQAAKRGSLRDRLLTGISVILAASPAYWLGLGRDRLLHLSRFVAEHAAVGCAFPAVGMTTPGAELHGLAHLADLARHSILPVTPARGDRRGGRRALRPHERARRDRRRLGAHRAARKGLAERTVMRRHLLANLRAPIVDAVRAWRCPGTVAARCSWKTIFGWPGMGR